MWPHPEAQLAYSASAFACFTRLGFPGKRGY